jgi:Zn-dependent peptidase ImmA (M78 family)/transcriptional regulator with XRE-family HTH domain
MPVTRENINPALLAFSRERMGYDVPDIARKIPVSEDRWMQWETGKEKPTTNQLITLADKLDRTPAFFYLKDVPSEPAPLSEFRTINNTLLPAASPKLITAIRQARRNREELVGLYSLLNQQPQTLPFYELNSSPVSEMAAEIRNWLGITFELQSSWSSASSALTNWKELLEEKDIYILQFPYVDVNECRGFAISEEVLPVIGINSKDAYAARVFTLMHELAHLLFRSSVLVNDGLEKYFGKSNKVEQVCNQLAAEILVPTAELRRLFNPDRLSTTHIREISNRFNVSGYVILIRLRKLRLISQSDFEAFIRDFSFYPGRSGKQQTGDAYANRIVQKGRLYMRYAFQSYYDGKITIAELANLTGWKVPNLNKLAAKTFGWPEEGQHL